MVQNQEPNDKKLEKLKEITDALLNADFDTLRKYSKEEILPILRAHKKRIYESMLARERLAKEILIEIERNKNLYEFLTNVEEYLLSEENSQAQKE